jgi:phosphate/sulfate permease
MAWNIGANDVANAMGTSVGSKALTLQHAVLLAAILEFSGAFFFGSHVSDTIQNGIVDPFVFNDEPIFFVYGMLSALIAAGVWLHIASYYGWPVSTTHSIIGSLIGFGAIFGGVHAIQWENVSYIVASWLVSPLLGGIIAYFLFTLLNKGIFQAANPLESAKQLTPFLVFLVFSILSLIMLFKGLQNVNLSFSFETAFGISLFVGSGAALISYYLVQQIKHPIHAEVAQGYMMRLGNNESVEKIFGYLQIITACLMAFAHGANDVANAIGPLAAAISVVTTHSMAGTASVPVWALALGGFGIVIGLATWGWRVIETIGRKITELTPSRGFAAEFGAATTVVLASRLGLPISTTHTLVGAVIGVGLARGIGALDLTMTRDIVISWMVTVPAGAILSVSIFYVLRAVFG